jgi:hypothetical protein
MAKDYLMLSALIGRAAMMEIRCDRWNIVRSPIIRLAIRFASA